MTNLKILLIHTAFPGDIILSIPLLRAISIFLKPKNLTILTTPTGKEILKNFSFISDFIVYDKNGKDSGVLAYLRINRKIQVKQFNLAFIPHKSLRSALFAFLAKIKIRIGFLDFKTSLISKLYTHRVGRLDFLHEIKRNLLLLSAILDLKENIFSDPNIMNFTFPHLKQDEENLFKKLSDPNILNNFVLISPCSNWYTKAWPRLYYIELTQCLIEKGETVILTASPKPNELHICSSIENTIRDDRLINLAGKTSLTELSFLISKTKLMITNDSAPMHIGSSHNIPLIALFGSTTKDLGFYPYSKNSILLEKELKCRPCGLHGKNRCPEKHFECMRNLKPEDVFSTALSLLS